MRSAAMQSVVNAFTHGVFFKRFFLAIFLFVAVPAAAMLAGGNDFHADFDELLNENVRDGLVYYQGFDNPMFAAYLDKLAKADIKSWSRNDQLAFWINAYNAAAIRQVLDNSQLAQPIDKADFFKEVRFTVAGQKYSLDQIENSVIRPQFNEALIHFGVVCAAKGCPLLLPEAYTGDRVMAMLRGNVRDYLESSAGMQVDRAAKTVKLSKIFEWYRVDFGKTDQEVLDYVAKYVDKETAGWMRRHEGLLKLTYLEYDWTMNRRG